MPGPLSSVPAHTKSTELAALGPDAHFLPTSPPVSEDKNHESFSVTCELIRAGLQLSSESVH